MRMAVSSVTCSRDQDFAIAFAKGWRFDETAKFWISPRGKFHPVGARGRLMDQWIMRTRRSTACPGSSLCSPVSTTGGGGSASARQGCHSSDRDQQRKRSRVIVERHGGAEMHDVNVPVLSNVRR